MHSFKDIYNIHMLILIKYFLTKARQCPVFVIYAIFFLFISFFLFEHFLLQEDISYIPDSQTILAFQSENSTTEDIHSDIQEPKENEENENEDEEWEYPTICEMDCKYGVYIVFVCYCIGGLIISLTSK